MMKRNSNEHDGPLAARHAPDEAGCAARIMSWRPSPKAWPWPAAAPSVRWHTWSPLAGHEVTAFLFQVGDAQWDRPPLTDCLSASEQARAARFKFEAHARRYRVGRAVTRHLLADVCERPAPALPWSESPLGKPLLTGAAPPRFNLSHSDDWALLAVSATLEVGVDLEMCSQRDHMASLGQRILSPTEALAWASTHTDANADALLRTWVRKEACLKALGVGLTVEMSSLTLLPAIGQAQLTPLGAPPRHQGDAGAPAALQWLDLSLPPDCPGMASIAWQAP